jgi:hypothetical protein
MMTYVMAMWRERCPDGKRCGHNDCPKCGPSKIIPSSQRGSSKPNRGQGGAGSKGYRIHPSGEKPKSDSVLHSRHGRDRRQAARQGREARVRHLQG